MPHPSLREIAIEVAGRFCPRPDCQLNISPTCSPAGAPATIYDRWGNFRLDDYATRYQNCILCYSCDRRYNVQTWFGSTTYLEVPPHP